MIHYYFTIAAFVCFLKIFITPTAHANDIMPESATGTEQKAIVHADHYMAVTAHPLATQAASNMLSEGGTAIDALITAQMVLNIVEPQSSGIGGGGFLLYYDQQSKKLWNFDGRETAPALAKTTMFLTKDQQTTQSFYDLLGSGLPVGTPGLLHMLDQAHQQFGKKSWASLFQPAILIANEGFPLSKRLHQLLNKAKHIQQDNAIKQLYFAEDNTAKPVGTIIKNPALATIFKDIANEGIEVFYNGYIADKISQLVQNHPKQKGYLTRYDFNQYQSTTRRQLCGSYRQYTVCSMAPPSSGGIALLQTLGILEHFPLNELQNNPVQSIHLISEATRIAFADRNYHVGDTDFVDVPINSLLSPEYLAKRAKEIDQNTAKNHYYPQIFGRHFAAQTQNYEPSSTTHLSIVDQYGNIASMTSTIEHAFGAGLMVEGFLLNNELTDFSFLPDKNGQPIANRVESRKRPRSSMTPVIVFDQHQQPVMVLGSPGGSRIIPYVIKTLIAVIDWQYSPQQAVSMPHFVTVGKGIELEENNNVTEYKNALQKMGHNVTIRSLNSGLHMIQKINGQWVSGVDPRREGSSIGK